MEQATNSLKHSTQIITFLSAKTASQLKLDLDPIFLSRELVFQSKIS